jgi:hypothetical protein
MTFTLRLERLDGAAADPPTFRTVAPRWEPATRSRWGRRRRCEWFASATTTPISRRYWSLRTWPKGRLAPSSDVS